MNETTSTLKDNQVPSPAKAGSQLGILFGIIMVLEFVIGYVMDIDPLANPMYGTIINTLNYLILPVLFISLACTSYKKANQGFISFGTCLKIGVVLCLIAALIVSIFNAIFNMIFPEYMVEILAKTESVVRQQSPDMTEEQLDMAMSWTRKFMNPVFFIPVMLVMYSFIGLIYSLIIGAIVKKDRAASY